MTKRRDRAAQGGYTVLEVLIAVAVLAVVAQAFSVFMAATMRQTVASKAKAEANEHALQMLEELRSVVIDDNAAIEELDKYADGRDPAGTPYYKFTLTTKREITHPGGNTLPDHQTGADRLSGNPNLTKGYKFVRHVDVVPDVNDSKLRRIKVRVWMANPNQGTTAASAAAPLNNAKIPMAEIFTTVRSLATGSKPTQVMDVFLIALENVPGWWSRTSNLIPLMRASLISLQARNPGLVLRAHWIRRLSYGRDVEYTPEVNSATRADAANTFKKAYIYPGAIQYDDGDDYYYLPTWFKGRINLDGTVLQSASDPVDGYPMADQWNHAMRLPDEERLYAIHKLVAANRGAEAPEMSLRMLLEKMNTDDPAMRNSIVINLHGEMVPVLPLRNYSDPAKDPQYFWNGRTPSRAWRAVTHPESLNYAAGSDVGLRVYAYDMGARGIADPITYTVEDDVMNYVTLFIPDADISNLKTIQRMQGNSRKAYAWKNNVGNTYTANATQWVSITSSANTIASNGATSTATALWWADNYTPPGRTASGLRIVFQGVTTTARAFEGKQYIP